MNGIRANNTSMQKTYIYTYKQRNKLFKDVQRDVKIHIPI